VILAPPLPPQLIRRPRTCSRTPLAAKIERHFRSASWALMSGRPMGAPPPPPPPPPRACDVTRRSSLRSLAAQIVCAAIECFHSSYCYYYYYHFIAIFSHHSNGSLRQHFVLLFAVNFTSRVSLVCFLCFSFPLARLTSPLSRLKFGRKFRCGRAA